MKAVIEVNKRVGWPNLLLQFVAGYDFARILQKGLKYEKGLLLEPNSQAPFAQLARTQIKFEIIEADQLRNLRWRHSTLGHSGIESCLRELQKSSTFSAPFVRFRVGAMQFNYLPRERQTLEK